MTTQPNKHQLAYKMLDHAWHDEWQALNDTDKANVATDFAEANITVDEYKALIWIGNLQAYAKTIR